MAQSGAPPFIDALIHANLDHWCGLCETLLARFEGIERAIEDREELEPAKAISNIIERAAHAPARERDQIMLEGLADLPLFRFRARIGSTGWNPLDMSLAQFEETSVARIWEQAQPFPEKAAIRTWIEGALQRP